MSNSKPLDTVAPASPEVIEARRKLVSAIVKEALDRPADSAGSWVRKLAAWLTDKEDSLQSNVVAEMVTLYEDSLYHVGHAALQAGIEEGMAAVEVPDPAPEK